LLTILEAIAAQIASPASECDKLFPIVSASEGGQGGNDDPDTPPLPASGEMIDSPQLQSDPSNLSSGTSAEPQLNSAAATGPDGNVLTTVATPSTPTSAMGVEPSSNVECEYIPNTYLLR
jgi:hypothetical protein